MPLFSVIVPTYNRATFLPVILGDLKAQQWKDFEVIIVDDGSTDGTEMAVKPLLAANTRYFKKENGERGAARNFGARQAKGEYLIFFDSDDRMYPNHLQTIAGVIKQQGHPPVLYSAYEIKTMDGKVIKKVNKARPDIRGSLVYHNFLACNSVSIRKEVFEQFWFTEDRRFIMGEDNNLWLRVAARYDFVQIRDITFAMIEHEGRTVNSKRSEQVLYCCKEQIKSLKADTAFNEKFGSRAAFFYAFDYCLLSLASSELRQLKQARGFLKTAVKEYPMVVFKKRFLAALKNSLIPKPISA